MNTIHEQSDRNLQHCMVSGIVSTFALNVEQCAVLSCARLRCDPRDVER